jgi:hypothetical protein
MLDSFTYMDEIDHDHVLAFRKHTETNSNSRLTADWKAMRVNIFPPTLIERPIAMTCPPEITERGPKSRKVIMVPYEEARPNSRGIGKYTKPEEETRSRSGRQDTTSNPPPNIGYLADQLD